MSTVIRPEISKKNPYYISKHRYYELKHFCLQYPEWISDYNNCKYSNLGSVIFTPIGSSDKKDIVGDAAVKLAGLSKKINLVQCIAKKTDAALCDYILKAVTEGVSYTYLKTVMNIPCGKDMFYDRYRKFYWLLNKERE